MQFVVGIRKEMQAEFQKYKTSSDDPKSFMFWKGEMHDLLKYFLFTGMGMTAVSSKKKMAPNLEAIFLYS